MARHPGHQRRVIFQMHMNLRNTLTAGCLLLSVPACAPHRAQVDRVAGCNCAPADRGRRLHDRDVVDCRHERSARGNPAARRPRWACAARRLSEEPARRPCARRRGRAARSTPATCFRERSSRIRPKGRRWSPAYNVLGYTAAAVGNHEFDFGPVGPAATPRTPADDPRGALKARASEARFPFLAANLIDAATGRAVEWVNVKPAVIVQAADIKVGIIGVMTRQALTATIASNVGGLSVAPLAETIRGACDGPARARRRGRHRHRACRRPVLELRSAGGSLVVRAVVRDLQGRARASARTGRRDRGGSLSCADRPPG